MSSRRREERLLGERIAKLDARVEEAPKNEQRMLELTRDYETLKQTYHLLLGDCHRHTDIEPHRGPDGSILDTYRYAIDAAQMGR